MATVSTMVDTAITTGRDTPNRIKALKAQTSPLPGSQTGNSTNIKSPSSPVFNVRLSPFKHVHASHHSSKTSILSHDAEVIPSFIGFRNLMVLVLIVSNLRLMIENFRKYGVLICIRCHSYQRQDIIYSSILYLLIPCHLFVAYIIEVAAAQQAKGALARIQKEKAALISGSSSSKSQRSFQSTWALIAAAHGINATLNLVIASTVVYYHIHHPGIGTLCELHAVIVWLKVCSYAFTNRDLRHALLLSATQPDVPMPELYADCPYPKNITLGNLCYFWWAPTLVYQPVYPRSPKIRWSFALKRFAEVAGLSIVIWFASAQYAAPLLQNSLDKISTLDIISIVERVLKLSTISLFCWLAGFFALFHSFLNGLAEITRFGDREFYTDWWNAKDIRTYWTTWNKPVYTFMKRHIYAPLVGRGMSPPVAQIFVFLFSGVLHELLVGIPTHNVLGIAFLGMIFQIPLIILTDPLSRLDGKNGRVLGNLVFWISFCLVGQPLAALLYFFAWQAKYGAAVAPKVWAT